MRDGINPWLMMWGHPRNTIRAVVSANPKYGMVYLASLYALQNLFYFFNYWSLGLSTPFYVILVAGLALCPFVGWAWIYCAAWALSLTGRWLNGRAPVSHLRAAFAWSQLPTLINLSMWFSLLVANPEHVFIQDARGPTALFINFITLAVAIWSFVLLVQSVREIQHFSVVRTFANLFFSWVLFSIFMFLVFSLFRFIYIRVVF